MTNLIFDTILQNCGCKNQTYRLNVLNHLR